MPMGGSTFIPPSHLAPNQREKKQTLVTPKKSRGARHSFKVGDAVIWRMDGCATTEYRANVLALLGKSRLVLRWQGHLTATAYRATNIPASHCRVDHGKGIRRAGSTGPDQFPNECKPKRASVTVVPVASLSASDIASALSPSQRKALLLALTAKDA